MARDPQERPDITALIRRIESSRSDLETHVQRLKSTLDVPSRVKQSILARPTAWFGGSMGVGLLASRMFRRRPRRTVKKSGGFVGLIFAALLALVKPTLKNLIVNELQRRFKSHGRWGNQERETHLSLSKDQATPTNS